MTFLQSAIAAGWSLADITVRMLSAASGEPFPLVIGILIKRLFSLNVHYKPKQRRKGILFKNVILFLNIIENF